MARVKKPGPVRSKHIVISDESPVKRNKPSEEDSPKWLGYSEADTETWDAIDKNCFKAFQEVFLASGGDSDTRRTLVKALCKIKVIKKFHAKACYWLCKLLDENMYYVELEAILGFFCDRAKWESMDDTDMEPTTRLMAQIMLYINDSGLDDVDKFVLPLGKEACRIDENDCEVSHWHRMLRWAYDSTISKKQQDKIYTILVSELDTANCREGAVYALRGIPIKPEHRKTVLMAFVHVCMGATSTSVWSAMTLSSVAINLNLVLRDVVYGSLSEALNSINSGPDVALNELALNACIRHIAHAGLIPISSFVGEEDSRELLAKRVEEVLMSVTQGRKDIKEAILYPGVYKLLQKFLDAETAYDQDMISSILKNCKQSTILGLPCSEKDQDVDYENDALSDDEGEESDSAGDGGDGSDDEDEDENEDEE